MTTHILQRIAAVLELLGVVLSYSRVTRKEINLAARHRSHCSGLLGVVLCPVGHKHESDLPDYFVPAAADECATYQVTGEVTDNKDAKAIMG